jgi:hypothetical protein
VPQQLDRTYADPWPALAVSATGYGALAWNREGRNVAVAVRAPGARFSAPIDIPAEGVVSAPVKVGVDDSGTATVLWSDWAGVDAPARVRYATVSAGGALTAVGTVGADTSPGGWVFLAVGSAGDVAAAWATAAAGASPGRETRVALRPREAVAPRDGNAASLPSQAMTPPPAVFSTTLKRSAATLGVVAGLLPAAVPATAAGLAGTNPGQPSDVRPNAGAATQGIIMRDGGICDPIRMGC